MEKYKGQYIGDKKISCVNLLEDKTYLGAERVEVEFTNEELAEYPLAMMDITVSEEPRDATSLSDARINPIIAKIIGVMAEAEITKDEIDAIVGSRLGMTLNQNLNDAVDKLFGKKVFNITLLDIEKILKK